MNIKFYKNKLRLVALGIASLTTIGLSTYLGFSSNKLGAVADTSLDSVLKALIDDPNFGGTAVAAPLPDRPADKSNSAGPESGNEKPDAEKDKDGRTTNTAKEKDGKTTDKKASVEDKKVSNVDDDLNAAPAESSNISPELIARRKNYLTKLFNSYNLFKVMNRNDLTKLISDCASEKLDLTPVIQELENTARNSVYSLKIQDLIKLFKDTLQLIKDTKDDDYSSKDGRLTTKIIPKIAELKRKFNGLKTYEQEYVSSSVSESFKKYTKEDSNVKEKLQETEEDLKIDLNTPEEKAKQRQEQVDSIKQRANSLINILRKLMSESELNAALVDFLYLRAHISNGVNLVKYYYDKTFRNSNNNSATSSLLLGKLSEVLSLRFDNTGDGNSSMAEAEKLLDFCGQLFKKLIVPMKSESLNALRLPSNISNYFNVKADNSQNQNYKIIDFIRDYSVLESIIIRTLSQSYEFNDIETTDSIQLNSIYQGSLNSVQKIQNAQLKKSPSLQYPGTSNGYLTNGLSQYEMYCLLTGTTAYDDFTTALNFNQNTKKTALNVNNYSSKGYLPAYGDKHLIAGDARYLATVHYAGCGPYADDQNYNNSTHNGFISQGANQNKTNSTRRGNHFANSWTAKQIAKYGASEATFDEYVTAFNQIGKLPDSTTEQPAMNKLAVGSTRNLMTGEIIPSYDSQTKSSSYVFDRPSNEYGGNIYFGSDKVEPNKTMLGNKTALSIADNNYANNTIIPLFPTATDDVNLPLIEGLSTLYGGDWTLDGPRNIADLLVKPRVPNYVDDAARSSALNTCYKLNATNPNGTGATPIARANEALNMTGHESSLCSSLVPVAGFTLNAANQPTNDSMGLKSVVASYVSTGKYRAASDADIATTSAHWFSTMKDGTFFDLISRLRKNDDYTNITDDSSKKSISKLSTNYFSAQSEIPAKYRRKTCLNTEIGSTQNKANKLELIIGYNESQKQDLYLSLFSQNFLSDPLHYFVTLVDLFSSDMGIVSSQTAYNNILTKVFEKAGAKYETSDLNIVSTLLESLYHNSDNLSSADIKLFNASLKDFLNGSDYNQYSNGNSTNIFTLI